MIEALDRRHEQYNETLALLKSWNRTAPPFVLAQTETVPIGRFEKNRKIGPALQCWPAGW